MLIKKGVCYEKIFTKSNIFFFILGDVIFSAVSVLAYSLIATDVGFTPTDTTWDVEDTKEALDDLFQRYKNIKKYNIINFNASMISSSPIGTIGII